MILFTIFKSFVVRLFELPGNLNFSQEKVLYEIFFVQNYLGGLWGHTWTLGVEEHFYLLLVIFVVVLIRIEKITITAITGTFLVVMVTCLLLRISNYLTQDFTIESHMYYTHLRIDSLFFGVFLSALYHFEQRHFLTYLKTNRLLIFALSLGFIMPIFFFDVDTFFMNTFGLSLLYLGFGGIMILFLYHESFFQSKSNTPVSRVVHIFSYIGKYSYSIYLWHLPVLAYIASPMSGILSRGIIFMVYFVGSVIIGIIASIAIEVPVLKFRDRRFSREITRDEH